MPRLPFAVGTWLGLVNFSSRWHRYILEVRIMRHYGRPNNGKSWHPVISAKWLPERENKYVWTFQSSFRRFYCSTIIAFIVMLMISVITGSSSAGTPHQQEQATVTSTLARGRHLQELGLYCTHSGASIGTGVIFQLSQSNLNFCDKGGGVFRTLSCFYIQR